MTDVVVNMHDTTRGHVGLLSQHIPDVDKLVCAPAVVRKHAQKPSKPQGGTPTQGSSVSVGAKAGKTTNTPTPMEQTKKLQSKVKDEMPVATTPHTDATKQIKNECSNVEVHNNDIQIGKIDRDTDDDDSSEVESDNDDTERTCTSGGEGSEGKRKKTRKRRSFKELVRNIQCKHEGCGRVYATESSLQNHIRLKHNNIRPDNDPRAIRIVKCRPGDPFGIPPSPITGYPATMAHHLPPGHPLAQYGGPPTYQHASTFGVSPHVVSSAVGGIKRGYDSISNVQETPSSGPASKPPRKRAVSCPTGGALSGAVADMPTIMETDPGIAICALAKAGKLPAGGAKNFSPLHTAVGYQQSPQSHQLDPYLMQRRQEVSMGQHHVFGTMRAVDDSAMMGLAHRMGMSAYGSEPNLHSLAVGEGMYGPPGYGGMEDDPRYGPYGGYQSHYGTPKMMQRNPHYGPPPPCHPFSAHHHMGYASSHHRPQIACGGYGNDMASGMGFSPSVDGSPSLSPPTCSLSIHANDSSHSSLHDSTLPHTPLSYASGMATGAGLFKHEPLSSPSDMLNLDHDSPLASDYLTMSQLEMAALAPMAMDCGDAIKLDDALLALNTAADTDIADICNELKEMVELV